MKQFSNLLKIHKSILDHELNDKLYHVLKELAIYGRTTTIKSVSGKNKFYHWRRSPLKGFHYYLWWLRGKRSIVVRSIRHHDNHNELTEGSENDFLLVDNLYSLRDIIEPKKLVDQLIPPVKLYHQAHHQISTRFLRGAPGTGKTTILRELAEFYHESDHVLFISRSKELNKFSYSYLESITEAQVDSLHLPSLLNTILNQPLSGLSVSRERKSFLSELRRRLYQVPRHHLPLYYELVRAYTFGMSDADKKTEEKLFAYQFNSVKQETLKSISKIFKKHPLFELQMQITHLLKDEAERINLIKDVSAFNTKAERLLVLIDEVQDHTSVELDLLLTYIKQININYKQGIELVFSGDEGQSIYPTRFTWAMLSRKLENQHEIFKRSSNHERTENLRSLPQIVKTINALDQRYAELPKALIPAIKTRVIPQDVDNKPHVEFIHSLYVLNTTTQLFRKEVISLANQKTMFISLYELPNDLHSLTPYVWEVDDIKGLEAQNIFIICDNGLLINDEIPLYTRMKLDRIRVSISRATERVILVAIDSILSNIDTHLKALLGQECSDEFKYVSLDELKSKLNETYQEKAKLQDKQSTSNEETPTTFLGLLKKPLKPIKSFVLKKEEDTQPSVPQDSFTNETLYSPLIELEELLDQCRLIKERSHEKSYQILLEAFFLAYESQDNELISHPSLCELYQQALVDDKLDQNSFVGYVEYHLDNLKLDTHNRLLLHQVLLSHLALFDELFELLKYIKININTTLQTWLKTINSLSVVPNQKLLVKAKTNAVELFCQALNRQLVDIDDLKRVINWRKDLVTGSDKYSVYLKNYFYFNQGSQQKFNYIEKRFSQWLSRSKLPFNPQMAYQMAGINLTSINEKFTGFSKWSAETIDQAIHHLRLKQVPMLSSILGDNNSRFKDETPEHNVSIRGFIQVSESLITDTFWNLCLSSSSPSFQDLENLSQGGLKSPHWIEAILFCNLLSKRLDMAPVYSFDERIGLVLWNPLHKGVRLLSEAEWEVIAWEGLDTPSGSLKTNRARVLSEARRRRSSEEANVFGLKDIGGVAEWVYDSFDEQAYQSRKGLENIEPLVDDMIIFNRLQRGEPSMSPNSALSLTKRFSHSGPMMQNNDSTFRIVIG